VIVRTGESKVVTVLVLLIILAPVLFFIYKKANKALDNVEEEEREEEIDSKLEEVKGVSRHHNKLKRVDIDEVSSKKKEIDKVLKA